MTRSLALFSLSVLCIAGCSNEPTVLQFVPSRTLYAVEPQPVTYHEFHEAERQGYLVAATGNAVAYDLDDLPTPIATGAPLHVLRVDPATGEVVARRLDDHTIVRLNPAGVEVRGTTFAH